MGSLETKRGIALACLLGLVVWSSNVPAVGPTGEQDALNTVFSNRIPLVMSGDGAWLFYVDRNARLRRVRVDSGGVKSEVPVGMAGRIRGLAPSWDGSRVAVLGADGCVGLATLDERPRFTWLPTRASYGVRQDGDRTLPCATSGSAMAEPQVLFSAEGAISLSDDGKRIAVYGDPVTVLDAASGRKLLSVPAGGGEVLHLQFLDQGRKLLVVLASFSEVWEGAPDKGGSDVQFIVWDLERRTLFNMHRTRHTDYAGLAQFDYFWHFSESSGDLWAIRTNGEYQDETGRLRRIRPYRVNLKECTGSTSARVSLEPSGWPGWRAFAADPLGRWLATVERPNKSSAEGWRQSTLKVTRVSDGALVWQRKFDSELHPLLPSADGRYLFGIAAAKGPEGTEETSFSLVSTGPIELVRIDLQPPLAAAGPARDARSWPEQACQLEDETADARNLSAIPPAQLKPVWKAAETGAWAVSPDGRLWRGRFGPDGLQVTAIEQLDLASGRVLQTVREGHPLFAQTRFVVSGYEKLTVRNGAVQWPGYVWGNVPAATPRPEFLLPGWRAESAWRTKDLVTVLWSRQVSPTGREWIYGRYGVDGTVFSEEGGHGGRPDAVKDFDEASGNLFGMDDPILWESWPTTPATHGWEHSVAGSLRAFRLEGGKPAQTVYWRGLSLGPSLSESDTTGVLLALEGPLVAEFNLLAQQVRIHDASVRRLVAVIPLRNDYISRVTWAGASRTLLCSEGGTLYAYRIAPP